MKSQNENTNETRGSLQTTVLKYVNIQFVSPARVSLTTQKHIGY